ncbi:hypothetical protein HBB16_18060 [Pseudonocardia sp. MCCB 268]|nr:hypothetical protein [Pseudonocardia cytotoxica]
MPAARRQCLHSRTCRGPGALARLPLVPARAGAARPVGARTDLLLLGVQDGRRDGAACTPSPPGDRNGDDGTVLVYWSAARRTGTRALPRHRRRRGRPARHRHWRGPERVRAPEIADALCRVVTGPETMGRSAPR